MNLICFFVKKLCHILFYICVSPIVIDFEIHNIKIEMEADIDASANIITIETYEAIKHKLEKLSLDL